MDRAWGSPQGVIVGVVLAVVAWVLGVALLGLWPQLPGTGVLLAMCGLGLGAALLAGWFMAARTRATARILVLVFVAVTLIAHGSTGLRSQERLQARLPHALEGTHLLVTGVVDDLPRRSAQGVQFAFRVEAARTLSGAPVGGVPERLWLGWWMDGHVDALMAAAVPEPVPGERWQLPVSLKRPHGTLNPGAFDAERWFLEQNLGASGSVSGAHRGWAKRLGRAGAHWLNPERWRAGLRERIDAHVKDPALAGLVAGLTIGDQSAVDAADWQLFRAAGVAHALSISGAHITIFAALAAPVAAWVWRQWPRGCLVWPAPLVGLWVGWLMALGYALLAGWGLPAQRTVAMLAVVGLVRTSRLNWPTLLVWMVAAAPIVVWDPWAVSGGVLAVVCSCGLAVAGGRCVGGEGASVLRWQPPHQRRRQPDGPPKGNPKGRHLHKTRLTRLAYALRPPAGAIDKALSVIWQPVRTQLLTALGLAPLAAACFGEWSLIGVVGNLVALPLITLVLTPLCMLGLLVPALWSLLPWVVDPLRGLMAWLVAWPGAVLSVPGSSTPMLALALFGAALALMNLPLRLRASGLALMVPLLWPAPRVPPSGQFEAWALDVGQGTAVLVRTRRHALLLDAGPAWGEGRDAGERVVLPVLRHLGVRRLDELVVTHRDLDHVGGAASVLKGLPVAQLRSSLEASHPLLKFPAPHVPCRRGQAWKWDGVRLEVLHPFGDEGAKAKPNTISCVLRIEDSQGRSLLLTGDIEREQEAALVRASEGASSMPLQSEGLIAPHHGSRTSSTEPFLRAVQPAWALAQSGYRNRYGHPARAVVARYAELGIPLLSSPWCGALLWKSGAEPQCWRQVQPRHWHDQPGGAPPATSR